MATTGGMVGGGAATTQEPLGLLFWGWNTSKISRSAAANVLFSERKLQPKS